MKHLEETKRAYIDGKITCWLALAELLQASILALTDPLHDRSPLGRMSWALRQLDLWEREKSAKSQK